MPSAFKFNGVMLNDVAQTSITSMSVGHNFADGKVLSRPDVAAPCIGSNALDIYPLRASRYHKFDKES
jgi:hypothetical protein